MGMIIVGFVAIVAALIVVIARPVNYSTNVPKELDEAVARSVFSMNGVSMSDISVDGQTQHYGAVRDSEKIYGSECLGEGHVILGYKDKGKSVEVYSLCSAIGYGFREGIMVDESGYSGVPTLFVFDKDSDNHYVFKKAKEAADGGEFTSSVKKMFPSVLAKKVISAKEHEIISKQLDEQCRKYVEAYLVSIGREAKISSYYGEDFKILSDYGVSDEVDNALYQLHPEYGLYIGSFERIENGVRYVYKQVFDNQKDGSGIVYFSKAEYDSGKLVEKFAYKVDGNQIEKCRFD